VNRETRELKELDREKSIVPTGYAKVPERFTKEAEAVVERAAVASPAFAAWAHKKSRPASASKKKRRKISDRSKTRNRR